MQHSVRVNRRDVLAIGLGATSALALPRSAAAQAKLEVLVAYYGALINVGPVAVGLEKGFYKSPDVEVTDALDGLIVRTPQSQH